MSKFLLLFVVFTNLSIQAQNWKTPAIDDYGRIVAYKDAAVKPDPEKEYKMFFHITSKKEREGVNASLWKIARLINLLEASQVSKENIHVAAVISGEASTVVLSQKAYKEKNGQKQS